MINLSSKLRTAAAAALLAAGLGLSGCTVEELEAEQAYVPYSGSEQYPIIVEKGPSTLHIANHGSLTPGQINALSNVARIASDGRTPVTVSRPSGASSRLSHEVANLLSQQGVNPRMIRMASHAGSAGGPVKVTVKKLHARTAPCGDWPKDMTETRMNELNYNHGCAVQSNVAAMVVDPEDFVAPTPMDPAVASTRMASIKALDSAAATATNNAAVSAGGGSGTPTTSGSP